MSCMRRFWRGLLYGLLLLPGALPAISIGHLTFAMRQDQSFIAKRVLNNNQSARIYQVAVRAIDRPGEDERRSRPADGELLFAPKQLTLQAGQAEYFKFFYRGPQDGRERYYRISFREIPPPATGTNQQDQVNLEPVVILDAILVVRPRKINFDYQFDPVAGTMLNRGNTYFKLLLKPGCESTDEQSTTLYMRPGDRVDNPLLRGSNEMYIIYDEQFIRLDNHCGR